MSIKAVALFSGGLDSVLATRLMLDQGIQVTALHIRTSLSYVDRARMLGELTPQDPLPVETSASILDVELKMIDVFDEYLPVVLEPRYGYGSGMNPCVDCRIFLLHKAKQWMEEHNFNFVFTGEVVGQRPKSQMKPTLRTVERDSGLRGYLLRPLSAKLLEPTIPELKGWVDRERLFGMSGRGRKAQIALAGELGIAEYAQPSGGCCYLIDQTYSRRLRDVLARGEASLLDRTYTQLLAAGRHIRLPDGTKVVVGRNERENDFLERRRVEGVWLRAIDYAGPTALVLGEPSREALEMASQIVAGYSRGSTQPRVDVETWCSAEQPSAHELLTVAPMPRDAIHRMMV